MSSSHPRRAAADASGPPGGPSSPPSSSAPSSASAAAAASASSRHDSEIAHNAAFLEQNQRREREKRERDRANVQEEKPAKKATRRDSAGASAAPSGGAAAAAAAPVPPSARTPLAGGAAAAGAAARAGGAAAVGDVSAGAARVFAVGAAAGAGGARPAAAAAAADVAAAPAMLSHTAVAFYAHKGGVGKSTLIFDTAIRAAATHNRHVVIIDADSQLNTTFKLLGRLNISEAELNGRFIDALLTQDSAQLTVPLTLDGAAADRQFPTLFSYLCGAPNGPGGPNFDLDRDFLVVPGTQDKVKFLLGSPMLHSLELQLSNAINEPQNHPAAAHVPRLFLSLLQHIKAAYDRAGHDVLIFVDMSPSSNTMNQNILLSCDHFVLPVNADSNSMVSLRLLFSYLRRWRHVHRSYLGAHYVKFLFVVLNRYKVLDTETRETSNIVDKFQRRIVDMIQQFLKAQEPAPGGGGPRLVNADFILDHGPHLLKVQDGMRWVSFCSDTHRSVFEITSSICRQEMGRALSGRDGVKVDSLQQEIAAIASEILGRI